ncbi:MAG: RluA family pseudouridine synthase [Hellea sp.]|nr:RluA family pseudouridine synthase [Hellea sp.]
MSGVQIITIPEEDEGQRLDRWFKRRFPHIAHGRVEKLLRTGQMRINGKRVKGSARIEAGDDIRIPPLPEPSEVKSERGPSDTDIRFMRDLVIYEDKDLIGLNKPFGLAVQGGTKTTRHIDGMLPALGKGFRLVHRLDRDTSGVLLVAKNAKAAAWAGRAFQSRRAEKIYWGVTNGVPHPKAGEIKGYMAKGRLDNRFGNKHEGKEVMVAVRHGEKDSKHAKTLYQSVQTAGVKAAFVAMQPLTGRTHQLRLHMQLLGAPIAGDPKYMTDRPRPGGLENKLHLHARTLTIPGPSGDITIHAPLPAHMKSAFQQLGFEENAIIDDWEDLK